MAELVWQRSGGNAIMVEEIIHALREGGPAVVPPTLRDLVLRRLNALPPAVQHCVRVLAHGCGPVSHRVLAAVVDLPEQDLTTKSVPPPPRRSSRQTKPEKATGFATEL